MLWEYFGSTRDRTDLYVCNFPFRFSLGSWKEERREYGVGRMARALDGGCLAGTNDWMMLEPSLFGEGCNRETC